jgi:hypothetical protein
MSKKIKLGVVGLDGHGPVFINEIKSGLGKTIGAEVVSAMPVPSVMVSAKQLRKNTAKAAALGAKITGDPAELAASADGVLILHDDGSKHLELARLFADKGKPVFVDKPIEANAAAARKLVSLFEKHKCPLFSASCLRFSPELTASLDNKAGGEILSAMTWAPYILRPTMPGWIYYGIHAVEPLFQILGPDYKSVRCVPGKHGPVIIGEWSGGRTGMAKGTAGGHHGYGFTVWREKANETKNIDVKNIYHALLKNIAAFFKTGKAPVSPRESAAVIAFMEKANKSLENNGEPFR